MADLVTGEFKANIPPLNGAAAGDCFTRMIHGGIEHALTQLVSEAFDLAGEILAFDDSQPGNFSRSRVANALNHYMTETSGLFFDCANNDTQRSQIKEKLNAFKNDTQNHAMLQAARDLAVQTPTLDAAFGIQDCSPRERQMTFLLTPFRHPFGRFENDTESVIRELSGALYVAMAITYAQGFALLAEASARRHFQIDLAEVARAWRMGSSARTEILEDIAAAFTATPSLPNLLCDEDLSEKVMAHQESLRHAVWRASELGTFAPGMLVSLDYLDSFKDAWLPVNLVQVQQRQWKHRADTEPIMARSSRNDRMNRAYSVERVWPSFPQVRQ